VSRMFNPPHPGEVLKEYLPGGVSVTTAAKKLGVSRQAFSAILNGRSGITADMALRLSKALGTSADSWLVSRCNSISGKRGSKHLNGCKSSQPSRVPLE